MKLVTPKFLVCLALAVGIAAAAPEVVAAQEASPEAQYRGSIMNAFRLHMGAMRAATGGAAPAGHVELHAVAFERMTQALANAFPAGSGAGTRALPAIWENRNDFMDKVSAIQIASAQVVTASRSGNAEAIGAALQALQGTCAGCHNTYRGPAN